jgi:hypothetical protein
MKVAAMIAEVITPLILAPSACGMTIAPGVGFGGNLLDDLGGGRYATDPGDADDRVELAARPEIEDVAAEQAAQGGDGQGQHAQQQQLQDRRLEQGVGFAENSQRQTEEEGRPIEEGLAEQLGKRLDAAFAHRDADEQREEQRRATGNSRHSSVQAITAKVSFCERLIFGPRSAAMLIPRMCLGTSHLIRYG